MENSPQETSTKNQETNLLDRFEQHYPGIFDDTIETEQITEPTETIEESPTESVTTEAYQYDDAETSSSAEEDSRVERAKRITVRVSKFLGNVAIVATAPLLTEAIQRHTVNRKMRASFIKDHKNTTVSQKAQKSKSEFSGSASDFQQMHEEEKQRREQERLDRQNRRKEFFS